MKREKRREGEMSGGGCNGGVKVKERIWFCISRLFLLSLCLQGLMGLEEEQALL